MTEPSSSGLMNDFTYNGIFFIFNGLMVLGCIIVAPQYESSIASLYDRRLIICTSSYNFGSAFITPGTSFHIVTLSALSIEASSAAE